jgi:hypothetical protein
MTNYLGIVIVFILVNPGWTAAEEFFYGFQLLVDFKAALKTQSGIGLGSRTIFFHITHQLPASLMIILRIKCHLSLLFFHP